MTGETLLEGRRIVVTRAATQASSLVEAIEAAGGVAVPVPTLEIRDPVGGLGALAEALDSLVETDWIAVTSPNGAARVVAVADAPPLSRIAAVGAATAEVLEARDWPVTFVPTVPTAAAMVEEFPEATSGRVLVVHGDLARPTLAEGLQARGWAVERCVAYRNVEPTVDEQILTVAAAADVVVFASPSAVERYVDLVGLVPARSVCIGPVTAASARGAGFSVSQAGEPTVASLIAAIAATR